MTENGDTGHWMIWPGIPYIFYHRTLDRYLSELKDLQSMESLEARINSRLMKYASVVREKIPSFHSLGDAPVPAALKCVISDLIPERLLFTNSKLRFCTWEGGTASGCKGRSGQWQGARACQCRCWAPLPPTQIVGSVEPWISLPPNGQCMNPQLTVICNMIPPHHVSLLFFTSKITHGIKN